MNNNSQLYNSQLSNNEYRMIMDNIDEESEGFLKVVSSISLEQELFKLFVVLNTN